MSTAVLGAKKDGSDIGKREKVNEDLEKEKAVGIQADETNNAVTTTTPANELAVVSISLHVKNGNTSIGNSLERKRKPRGPKKRRNFEEIPGSTDILVHCSNKCGRFYRTPPCHLDRSQWHKTLRKLNAHESQRCILAKHRRSEKRKRRKNKSAFSSKKNKKQQQQKKKTTKSSEVKHSEETSNLPALEDEPRGSDNSSSASSSPIFGEARTPPKATLKLVSSPSALSLTATPSPRGMLLGISKSRGEKSSTGSTPNTGGVPKGEKMSRLVQAVHLWLDRARESAADEKKKCP